MRDRRGSGFHRREEKKRTPTTRLPVKMPRISHFSTITRPVNHPSRRHPPSPPPSPPHLFLSLSPLLSPSTWPSRRGGLRRGRGAPGGRRCCTWTCCRRRCGT
ncbi:unnamed protein product [Chondrus crispus]|uniref:Uncharacterized protein n=1 Tax=Chondrus crispus TaxID=2769 RepID=R7QP75_CHOCR|nr:unnamed protein product [Chondrus crispus]CDF39286.1 unnamed protein product [Chondrus crispus]|eukprot:XP_005719197.1 unnamed protein product [Chondrus crispus]